MSNVLAIASVTRLLKDLLNDSLVNGDITGDIGTDVVVSALPPDRALEASGESAPSRLNLFLHRITTNAALANSDLPTRDFRGEVLRPPRLALDLHYLLTAYAEQELHGEILLGYAMQMLHENAVLPRDRVRAALQGNLDGGILPPAFATTDPARLADQIELVRITPETLSIDDMSKIWTAFQTHYRTTLTYMVSVVLIAREQPVRKPLPVLSRGPVNPETGRDRGVLVHPDLLPTSPVIMALALSGNRPAARLGDTLAISGHRLDAGDAIIRFTEADGEIAIELAPAAPPVSTRLEVALPAGAPLPGGDPLEGTGADPGAWRIGAYFVEVVLRRAGEGDRITNRVPMMLAPRAAPAAAAIGQGTRITVDCQPRIRSSQTRSIIAGQAERLVALPDPPAGADQVVAEFAGLTSGASLPVRLRVAGIDSIVIDPGATPPRFDPSQIVTVP